MTQQASKRSKEHLDKKKSKVLVSGASGLIGVAAIEAFLSAGWDVVGISRRKPALPSGRSFDFISVDLRDEHAARKALSPLSDVTHVAYAAIYENANDLVRGWSNADQIAVNNAMLRNVIEPLISGKSALKHVSILQGTKAYGVHLHPIAIPARESDPRDDHANFFFDQQDYIREMGAKYGFTYTVLRPQLVTGETPGALNVLPAIGVYAAIRREKGEPFSFPGGPSFVWEAADANLVGQVMRWAAQARQAANEIFNAPTATCSSGGACGRRWPRRWGWNRDPMSLPALQRIFATTPMFGRRSSPRTALPAAICVPSSDRVISTQTLRLPMEPQQVPWRL
jgi:nucleoside-diphosphate-sugar epimerase